MSNSRPFRRRITAIRSGRRRTKARYPWGPPSMSTVRRQLKHLEAEGIIERTGLDHTGKPGRPSVLYGLTEKGRNRRDWTADELAGLLVAAVNERRFKDVPYLLPLLRAKDEKRARRLEKSLIRHGYRARDLPRGRPMPTWQPRGVTSHPAGSRP